MRYQPRWHGGQVETGVFLRFSNKNIVHELERYFFYICITMNKELDTEIDNIIETMEDDDSGFVFNKHIATYIFGIAMGILISLVVIAGIGESQLEHKNFNDTITTNEIIQYNEN